MSNIKVGIKFRPIMENENKSRQWIVDGNQIYSKHMKNKFSFSNVFNEFSTNHDVYSLCAPIVRKSLNGFNGTVLTYGQTSSGKTYTMMGDNGTKGIVEMAIDDIFDSIHELNDKRFTLRVGFIEIYNEKIYDLLEKVRKEIKIFEMNRSDFIVKSKEDIMKYLRIGNRNKHIGSNLLNEFSSRSHTMFTIAIDSTDSLGETKSSKLIFGDLAGSERPDKTKDSFNEGLHINKSLLALGKIIRELSKPNANMKNVRFRESLLTRLLASSLGGNSYTTIICTASSVSLDETFNTICFAQNAEKAKCKPTANSINDSTREVSILKDQVQKLQQELDFERSRILDNSTININTTFQVTNTIRKTECLKRKFRVETEESFVEHPVKIFIKADMSAIEEDKELIEDLKKQVSEVKNENDDLKAQLHDCKQNLENLMQTEESLKNDLKEKSHKGWKIKEKCKMLRNKLIQKKEKLSSIKANSSNLIDTHDGLDEIACFENLKSQYEQDIMHKNLIIFGLEKELKEFKDALKTSENRRQIVSIAVNTDTDYLKIEDIQQENYNQQHMIQDLNRKTQELLYANQMLHTKIKELNLQIDEIKRERDEFRNTGKNIKENFQKSLRNTRKQFHNIVEQKQKQTADFRRQLIEIRNDELKNHLKLQEHYEKQCNTLKINNKRFMMKIVLLEKELKAKNEHILQYSKKADEAMNDDKSHESEKMKFIKTKFESKLSETVKYFERLLEHKEKELNDLKMLRECQNSDKFVVVNSH